MFVLVELTCYSEAASPFTRTDNVVFHMKVDPKSNLLQTTVMVLKAAALITAAH